MKNGRAGFVMSAALAALLLSGCAHDPTRPIGAPVLDSQFGDAVKRARAMQVIRPEGVEVNDQGYSGSAAQRAMDRYSSNGSAAPNGAPPVASSGSAPPAKAPQ